MIVIVNTHWQRCQYFGENPESRKEQIRTQHLHSYGQVFFEFIDKIITIAAMNGGLVASYCPPIRAVRKRNVVAERRQEFGFCRQQECWIAFAEQIRWRFVTTPNSDIAIQYAQSKFEEFQFRSIRSVEVLTGITIIGAYKAPISSINCLTPNLIYLLRCPLPCPLPCLLWPTPRWCRCPSSVGSDPPLANDGTAFSVIMAGAA